MASVLPFILEKYSEVDRKVNGLTPLMVSVLGFNFKATELLLKKGAAVDVKSDKLGRTALHYASISSNWQVDMSEVVTTLIKGGADSNSRDMSGRTPLIWSVKMGNGTISKLLIVNGADIAIKDEFGKSARDYLEERPAEEYGL